MSVAEDLAGADREADNNRALHRVNRTQMAAQAKYLKAIKVESAPV